jgi:hypothetical protein
VGQTIGFCGLPILCPAGQPHITLRPMRPKALLKKEHGVWVYQGERTSASISGLIDRERKKRLRELMG